jgi:ribokinase
LPAEVPIRFVAVGDVMVDVVCAQLPASGTRAHAEVSVRAGGSAVNAATAAAEAGALAIVVGRVGSDPAADLVEADLRGRGVEAHLGRDGERTTGAAVALGADTVVAHRGANATFSPDDVPDPLEGDALLVSGFVLFQEGSSHAGTAALERFRGDWKGLDLASPKLAAAAEPGIDDANVVLATAEEALAVTGAAPERAARSLAARFEVACVKLGEAGAIAVQGEQVERCAAQPVPRRSPFGAGDAFGAVFLVALARGQPVGRALELACQAGARAASGAK